MLNHKIIRFYEFVYPQRVKSHIESFFGKFGSKVGRIDVNWVESRFCSTQKNDVVLFSSKHIFGRDYDLRTHIVLNDIVRVRVSASPLDFV